MVCGVRPRCSDLFFYLSIAVNKFPQNLKLQALIISHGFLGSGIQGQLGSSGSGSATRLQSRCWLRPQLSEGLTRAGESASKVAHSTAVDWRPWLLSLGPLHGLLKCPYNVAAGFPQSK